MPEEVNGYECEKAKIAQALRSIADMLEGNKHSESELQEMPREQLELEITLMGVLFRDAEEVIMSYKGRE